MVNEHESPTDNYCQISVEYVSHAAEISRRKLDANAGDVKVRKNPRYGDNIENRIDGQSLLADQDGCSRCFALSRCCELS
jgi:methyltransferase-like protein